MRETMQRVVTHEVDDLLRSISIPTTIIWGEVDAITPLAFARRLVAGIPQARLRLVPGAKHGVPFTHTDQVVQYICEAIDV